MSLGIPAQSTSLKNYSVAAFESRMRLPMERLILNHGGLPRVVASMQEVPIENNPSALAYFDRLKKNEFDVTILLTGVATRYLIQALETRFTKAEILAELAQKTKLVCRGPKPTKVCNIHDLPVAFTADEPNTWREIIAGLEDNQLLAGKSVAVIEYGVSNQLFNDELEARGAKVQPVPVYTWSLPTDVIPLRTLVRDIAEGKLDMALFTTQIQAVHLLQVAGQLGCERDLRRHLARMAIGSIGPTTSERLQELQIFPDFEATPNKMDHLVNLAAQLGPALIKLKQARFEACQVRLDTSAPSPALRAPSPSRGEGIIPANSIFLQSLRGQKAKQVPIWLMRQAGRYLAEYQLVRKNHDFLALCKNPELATEVTLNAVERLGVDAAIIFSDILIPLDAMGLKVRFHEGMGPVIDAPVKELAALGRLTDLSNNPPHYVYSAIGQTRKNLKAHIPLIGFVGAPLTMASYLIEGRSSKQFIATKSVLYETPELWKAMLEKLTTNLIYHAQQQIAAGCEVIQVFESWAQAFSKTDYQQFVLPYTQRLIASLKEKVPTIFFGSFSGEKLALQKISGASCLSLFWNVSADDVARDIPSSLPIQGNLDPTLLFCKPNVFLPVVKKILDNWAPRGNFIFNLGHGILPETPADHVLALVDYVHEWKDPPL